MRAIDLDGTKAGYERVKLLSEAEDYGQEVVPESTAPFIVRWDSFRKAACVLLSETLIAHVDTSKKTPVLQIRDGYPEKFDFALLRALRNTVEIVDAIGKAKRAEDKEKLSTEGLFARAGEQYEIKIQEKSDLYKAIIGMMAIEKRLTLVPGREIDDVRLVTRMGKTQHFFTIKTNAEGRHCVRAPGYDTYVLRETAFNTLLENGLATFEARMNPDALKTALQTLLDTTPPIDHAAIKDDYQVIPSEERTETASCRHGLLSSVKLNHHVSHRFNGIEFGTNGFRNESIAHLDGLEIDDEVMEPALRIMLAQWTCAQMGKRVQDYPLLTPDLIADKIENTDFGYDG